MTDRVSGKRSPLVRNERSEKPAVGAAEKRSTTAPRCGTSLTRPSPSSAFSASRTGVRLMPSSVAICSIVIRSSGLKVPSRIARLIDSVA